MTPSWDAIGAIAEALGALGVIATLAYLATQIRQNTRSLRASTNQALTETYQKVSFKLVDDPAKNRSVVFSPAFRAFMDAELASRDEQGPGGDTSTRAEV